MFALILILLSLPGADSTLPQLPEVAQRILETRLTVKWTFVNRYFYKCDLNGDSLDDYTIEVTLGEGRCLVEYYVALIAYNQSYAFHLLSTAPASMGLADRNEFLLRH